MSYIYMTLQYMKIPPLDFELSLSYLPDETVNFRMGSRTSGNVLGREKEVEDPL